MRSRYPSSASNFTSSFGPGPLTPAIKILIAVNVAVFLGRYLLVRLTGIDLNDVFGLRPVAVIAGFQVWQLVTYLFLHAGPSHIFFNMLALWMFGVELERTWGTRFFTKYYFITGIGAGVVCLLVALTPFGSAAYLIPTIGASGAIYGLLLAYGLYFPNRPIYVYAIFPLPAKYLVMIMGAFAFFAAADGAGSGVAHWAHLGGLIVGYIYLKGGRPKVNLVSEIQYRYLKWKINRMRRKFDVYSGGRADDVNRRVH